MVPLICQLPPRTLFCSVAKLRELYVTSWAEAHQTSLFSTLSQSLLKFMSIKSLMSSNHLILCCPLLPPALNLSQHQGLFQCVASSHQVSKYWSLSFSISPSSEYSGLISFRIGWFDLLALPGTLKSLLQHHSSKASILQCSAFFVNQVLYPYMILC